MKNPIDLQEEFENLITELERLKSINELTSANVESSMIILDGFESYVNSASELQKKMELDYFSKSKTFKELQDSFKNAIDSINLNVQAESKKFKELTTNHSKNSIKATKESTRLINEELSSFKVKIKGVLDKHEVDLNTSLSKIHDGLIKLNGSIDESEQLLKRKLDFITESIQNTEDSLHKTIFDNQKKIKISKNLLIALLIIAIIGFSVIIFQIKVLHDLQ